MFDRDFPSVDQVLGSIGDEPTMRVLAVEEAVNDALLSHETRHADDRAQRHRDGPERSR